MQPTECFIWKLQPWYCRCCCWRQLIICTGVGNAWKEEAAQEELQQQSELEQQRLAMQAEAPADEEKEALSEEEQTHLTERQTLERMIDDEPEQVAELIKTWLAEE